MNVYKEFARRVRETPSSTAIVRPDASDLSFRDIDERAKQVAAWLDSRGYGADDRIAVYLPDRPPYLPVLLGIWRAGCVATPVNTRFGMDELDYTLNDVRPSALLTSNAYDGDTSSIVERVATLSRDDVLEIERDGELAADLLPPAEVAPTPAKKLDEDILEIMYTSGSTGRPKGVIHTHRNLSAQLSAEIDLFGHATGTTSIVPLPLFHVGGLQGIALPSLFAGGSILVQEEWDPVRWAELVETTGATFAGFIPTLIVDLVNSEEARSHDTSSLDLCFYGGAPAAKTVLEEFKEAFDVDALMNYYGQTEVTGLSVTTSPDLSPEPGLIGTATPAVRTRVVDLESRRDARPGEPGELLVKGDVVTPGYWNRSDVNQAYFTDGWLHTDDVVREDEDGYLHYVDRADDMIITGGENVAPSAVENALSGMPDIDAVAVLGTPHERWGEAVTAVIVPATNELTEGDVLTFWEENIDLAGYQKPRNIFFVDEFPRTASQKIDKNTLAGRVTSDENR